MPGYNCFFFFKQKTAYEIIAGDWSSDVCSSDLTANSIMLKMLDQIYVVSPLQQKQ